MDDEGDEENNRHKDEVDNWKGRFGDFCNDSFHVFRSFEFFYFSYKISNQVWSAVSYSRLSITLEYPANYTNPMNPMIF